MVDEAKRAWHAGRSHWRGIDDINSASIGIEIVNPGHEWGYRPFPDAQMGSLIPLMHDIVQRHGITRGNIVGHSDVAPARKQDPGELFPWGRLARLRLALPRPTKNLMDPLWSDGAIKHAPLHEAVGQGKKATNALVQTALRIGSAAADPRFGRRP